jgi:hypothetical protein
MPDEQVMTGSAGRAKRLPRRRADAAARAAAADRADLDRRERNISPRRKSMGPTVPPEGERRGVGDEAPAVPDQPPTDPE